MDRQPGEQPRGRRRGAGARVSSGLSLFACLLCVGLAAGSLVLAPLNGRSPGETILDENIVVVAILTVTFFVVGALIASHRPGNGIGWIFCAAAITLIWRFLIEGVPDPNPLFEAATAALGLFVVASIPVAASVAIFRYRLYDIDLINRTLVHGALTVMLVLVYVGGVVGLQYIFRALTGGASELAVFASTLTIAALLNPLRRSIQAFIDRLFYRRRYDARKPLEAFSSKHRDETGLDRFGEELVPVVRGTVQPAHTSLWLRSPGRAGKEER